MNFGQLLVLDADLSVRLRLAESPGILRSIAMFFAHSGDSWLWAAGILLVWFFGSPFWKSRALILGISVVITALLVLIIKFTVRRKRPEGNWGEIYRSTDPHSFPSGHAARSFMLAVLAIGLGPAWFAILLLIWAPLVGLARVAMGVHYLSDVIVGAFLGILMGLVNLNLVPLVVNELVIKLL
jgi:undecaprenyl-diphosphatase